MLKRLRKWREQRACKRCKLRAVCLSLSIVDMGRKLFHDSLFAFKGAMPCKAVWEYGDWYREHDNTGYGNASDGVSTTSTFRPGAGEM